MATPPKLDRSSSLKELKSECNKRKIDTCLFIEKSEYIEAIEAHRYYDEERTFDGAHALCRFCGSGEDSQGNEILLCDTPRCPEAWHLQCLRPRLTAVPSGAWHCAQARPQTCADPLPGPFAAPLQVTRGLPHWSRPHVLRARHR